MESTANADEFVAESNRGASLAPRLFIKEMVMRNFKSYAGEQRVGPFHKVRVFRCSRNPFYFCELTTPEENYRRRWRK